MPTLPAFRAAPPLAPNRKTLIVHAEAGWFDHIREGGCDFFEKIGLAAAARGLDPRLVAAESPLSPALLASRATHIMMGPKRHRGARIHHAHPSYVAGFWYLDPRGYFWNSSLAETAFVAEDVDPDAATYFFNGVSGYNLRHNISKRPQAARGALEPAAAAVIVQDIEKYAQPVHYLTTTQILDTIARSAKGPIHVKLHPLMRDEARAVVVDQCARYKALRLTDASIHDIVAASDVIVSQNSAVGFEALMQRKAVLTCAACDYHHATLVCRNPEALAENLAAATDHVATFPFERYFYWFLGLNMLEPQKSGFEARALERLAGMRADG